MSGCTSRMGLVAAVGMAFVAGCRDSQSASNGAAVVIGPTLDFVISAIAVDSDDTSPAAGINVDGLYSTGGASGCGLPDRVSDLDGSENMGGCLGAACQGGVDNMLPLLIDTMDDALFDNVRS